MPRTAAVCIHVARSYRMCGAVLDGAAYVIGGMPLYEGPTAPSHTVSDSVMRYDPASDTWTTLPGAHAGASVSMQRV